MVYRVEPIEPRQHEEHAIIQSTPITGRLKYRVISGIVYASHCKLWSAPADPKAEERNQTCKVIRNASG